MSYSHRIFIYGPVGLLALVVAGYGLYWKVAADTLSARLDQANGGEVAPGISFAFAEKSVGGFPFRLDVVLDGVTLANKTPQGETAWRTEKLAIHALSYGTGRFVFETTGLQSIARPGAPGGPPKVLYLTPALSRASAILKNGSLVRADIDLLGVQGKDASLNAGADRDFTAGRAQFHMLETTDGKLEIAVKIEDAKIGAGYAPQLGPDMALLQMQGLLTPASVFDAARAGKVSPFDALASWSAGKGLLDVTAFSLKWAGAAATAKGALHVALGTGPSAPTGEGLHLQGDLKGTLTGFQNFITAAKRTAPPDAQALTAILTRDANDVPNTQSLPATIDFADDEMRVGVTLDGQTMVP